MKFVHAADLHLDSPVTGLSRYDGAPDDLLRFATRRAMQNLTRLCIEEQAALLLIAGDLFDGDWKDYSTGLFFVSQLKELERVGVKVALIRGNHDAMSQVTKHLKLPSNVRELSALQPETVLYEEWGIALHGQSYARRAETDDLAQRYPMAVPGFVNIGLLHTAASGRPGHETYAPCRLETLQRKGYDYWALGHVHQREILSESPWVVFPGNLQGRHFRETGPKGATLVTLENGRIQSVEARELDVVRFWELPLDVSSLEDTDAVLDAVERGLATLARQAELRMLVVRVVLSGSTTLHRVLQHDSARWLAEIRSRALELPKLWVADLQLATRSTLELSKLAERDDPVGRVFHAIAQTRKERALQSELASSLSDLLAKLPADVLSEATYLAQQGQSVPQRSESQRSESQPSESGIDAKSGIDASVESAVPSAQGLLRAQAEVLIAAALDDVEQILLAELSAEDESA